METYKILDRETGDTLNPPFQAENDEAALVIFNETVDKICDVHGEELRDEYSCVRIVIDGNGDECYDYIS